MKKRSNVSNQENRDLLFLHLTQILAMLVYYPCTITEISQAMNIPIAQARHYILELLSIKELSSHITYHKKGKTGKYVSVKFTSSDKEVWSKQLITGYYDDLLFSLNPSTLFLGEKLPLWLTPIEASQLAAKYPELFNKTLNILNIKRDISLLPKVIKDRAFEIQDAILDNKEISFYYKGIHKTGILPQLLYHDTDRNLIYCVDNNNHYYRLDRMSSTAQNFRIAKGEPGIKTTEEPSTKPPLPDKTRKRFDYMWGMADSKEEPVQVCVKIYHDTRNILNKIKDETRLRKYARIEEHEGFSYYYDTIIGLNSFRSWLRGYGSSLIVLEPEFLAEQMKETARNVIKLYS